jgi:hypothetical protein
MGPGQGVFGVVSGFFHRLHLPFCVSINVPDDRSFGLNHYGTSYTTGERLDRATASPVEYAFGRTKRVYEKDGKLIGTKGENGHPYDGGL